MVAGTGREFFHGQQRTIGLDFFEVLPRNLAVDGIRNLSYRPAAQVSYRLAEEANRSYKFKNARAADLVERGLCDFTEGSLRSFLVGFNAGLVSRHRFFLAPEALLVISNFPCIFGLCCHFS